MSEEKKSAETVENTEQNEEFEVLLKRVQADFENYRRRTEKENEAQGSKQGFIGTRQTT